MEENSTSPPPESRERSCFPFAFCTVPFAICTVPFAISTVLDRADGARRALKKKFSPPPWPPHGRLKKKIGPFKMRTGPYKCERDRSKGERDRTDCERDRTECERKATSFTTFRGGGQIDFSPITRY